MALISPGVQVTVIDESTYQPTAVGTVPYVLLATAQDKQNPSGSTATATTKANAGKLVAVSSQRELVSLFGAPTFQQDAAGNPINADELNEYGLLAAYSALGVANKVYIQRADVNLSELTGTSIRPTGTPVDGTYWLDLDNTNWGIYEWTADTGLTLQTPRVITSTADLIGGTSTGAPLASVGTIGSYAVNTTLKTNPVYYKMTLPNITNALNNTWQLVGSENWKFSQPAVVGTVANPTVTYPGNIVINHSNVVMTSSSVDDAVTAINAEFGSSHGVIATKNVTGQLELRINASSKSNGSVADGKVTIGTDLVHNAAVSVGLTAGTYNSPAVQFSSYRNVPAWRTTDTTPRPYGSVWFKTSATGNGANWALKEYSATLDSWLSLTAPLYNSDTSAIENLDPTGGGAQLPVGTLYVKTDVDATGSYDSATDSIYGGTGKFKPYIKNVAGLLKITGSIPADVANVAVSGHSFTIEVSVPGASTMTASVTLSGTSAAQYVADILSKNLPNITAQVETTGAISITHIAGGTIKFTQVSGTAITSVGLDANSHVQTIASGTYLASPFTALDYTYSTTAPYSDPVDGTLWYYNSPLEIDILVNSPVDGGWVGYKMVSNDARGYDLSATDPAGPILSTTRPVQQLNGAPLVPGDLWIDTGDLENYPIIYRYTGSVWELIDNTDQVSADGILFADARWGYNDTIDPIVDDIPSIVDLQNSDHLDPDAPDYRLYARGTLLWNTRRSGFDVKVFDSQLFANETSPPTVVAGWSNHSGLDQNGVPYFGHKAQRNTIVEAMKAVIESSTDLREEQTQFNVMCTPGYPELIQNMITLNNDRKQTAFIIGDSPLTLNSSTQSLETWAKNTNLALDNGLNGLVSHSEYLGVYYPSGYATNLDGNSVVVPPSHIMLRTMIRSDNVSYPWFAPAGVRRGLIDNATSIGYVDTTDNNLFRSIGVTNALRDTLYAQNINPLTVLPGVGLVAYGQKTRAALTSSMDRINVARLVCYLRIVLDSVARPFIFEPNDTITRNQVKSAFESVLNDIVAKRGIYDYLVVCDTSNNTPDRIDRNELWVDIAIEPVKAIEFIYIPVRLKNTGAIAAGV